MILRWTSLHCSIKTFTHFYNLVYIKKKVLLKFNVVYNSMFLSNLLMILVYAIRQEFSLLFVSVNAKKYCGSLELLTEPFLTKHFDMRFCYFFFLQTNQTIRNFYSYCMDGNDGIRSKQAVQSICRLQTQAGRRIVYWTSLIEPERVLELAHPITHGHCLKS